FFSHTTSHPTITTLSLPDALPISAEATAKCAGQTIQRTRPCRFADAISDSNLSLGRDGMLPSLKIQDRGHVHPPGNSRPSPGTRDRKSTRLNSSHEWISYAVFCLK